MHIPLISDETDCVCMCVCRPPDDAVLCVTFVVREVPACARVHKKVLILCSRDGVRVSIRIRVCVHARNTCNYHIDTYQFSHHQIHLVHSSRLRFRRETHANFGVPVCLPFFIFVLVRTSNACFISAIFCCVSRSQQHKKGRRRCV